MAESKPHSSDANEEQGINVLDLLGKAKGEIDSILHIEKSSSITDIDDTSIINIHDVKAPNLFERAKEEIDAIVQTIHTNKQQKNDDQLQATRSDSEADSVLQGQFEKVANLIERGQEEIETIIGNKEGKSSNEHQQSETHGLRDDIDENTPLNVVKAPNLFERAKEELEAIVDTIHQKKESASTSTNTSKEIAIDAGTSGPSSDGFWLSVGRQLEKCCSPFDHKKD